MFVSQALAADLTYSADVTVTLSSPAINYTIKSGSVATTVVVNANNLTVTIPTSSNSFTITSATRGVTTTGQSVQATVSTSCDSSSVQTVSVTTSTQAETVVFTPTSAACTYASGGGGGGGGGGATPAPTSSTPTTTNGTVNSTPEAGGNTTFTPSDSATPAVNVSLPVGAVSSVTTVSVSNTTLSNANISVGVSGAGGTSIIGSPYSITATSGSGNVTSFGSAVTLTFTYTDAQLPAGVSPADLVVMYFNTATNSWVVLPTTVNSSTHTITTSTNHLTVFAVVVKPGGSGTAGRHANGTLINDNGTFYLISNGQKIGFRDPKEYASYGYNFGQAVSANAQDKAMPQAEFVKKAMEGTLVLDASDGRTVYMIGTGATKRGFVSAAVFTALGYSFAGLPKINLSDYPVGAVIGSSTEAHPDGSLVFQGKTIWWLRNNQKTGFETMAVFNTYGFSVKKVLVGNAADFALPEGSIIKFRDGTLVKDGSTYYLISDGKKMSFSSASDLTTRGYKVSNAITASLAPYVDGGAVQ
jgi:hypothetical protein